MIVKHGSQVREISTIAAAEMIYLNQYKTVLGLADIIVTILDEILLSIPSLYTYISAVWNYCYHFIQVF